MTPEERRLELRRRQLAARVRAADPAGGVSTNSEAISDFKRKMGAGVAGAVNGASFGLADEATGLIGGVGSMLSGDGFSSGYASERDAVRAEHAKRQQSDPMEYGAGQIGGATIPAIASAPYATGRTLLGTMARGGALGAGEGALHGFGNGEGVADRTKSAVNNAILGAMIGSAIPAGVSGVNALSRSVTDPIGGALNIGNTGRANRAIAKTVEKSGKTTKELAQQVAKAAAQGQPEYRIMDALGVTGQRRASGLARGGGQAGDDIAEFLSRRQLDQGDRVAGFVRDAYGFNGRATTPGTDVVPLGHKFLDRPEDVLNRPQVSAAQTKNALTSARTNTANDAYAAARGDAGPVDVRGAIDVIDARIGGMQGVDIAGDSIDGRLKYFRNRLAANQTPDGVDSIELSDFSRVLGVKQELQDAIGVASRQGRNNEVRELSKLMSELDNALEQSSPSYRKANDQFREASRVIDSVDAGANMTSTGRRAVDTTLEFQNLTPTQQAAARLGYGDRALAKIEANPAPTANKARPFQSSKAQAEAEAMALNPSVFRDRLARETQMWETQNRALGGSRTADNLEDIGGANQLAQQATGIGGSLATGNVGHALANTVQAIAPRLTGQNEATRLLMARALMSQNPQTALAPAMQSRAGELLRQRMLEALIRNASRQGYQ